VWTRALVWPIVSLVTYQSVTGAIAAMPVRGQVMASVLVADDEPEIRSLLRVYREDHGHEVQEAEDGGEALILMQMSRKPLVVLLDLAMPQVDGLMVLQQVARDPALQRHRIAVMTGEQQLALRLPAGVPMVAKPFDLELLLATVAALDLEHVP